MKLVLDTLNHFSEKYMKIEAFRTDEPALRLFFRNSMRIGFKFAIMSQESLGTARICVIYANISEFNSASSEFSCMNFRVLILWVSLILFLKRQHTTPNATQTIWHAIVMTGITHFLRCRWLVSIPLLLVQGLRQASVWMALQCLMSMFLQEPIYSSYFDILETE